MPDIVVLSKPDLYDMTGALTARLKAERYVAVARFTAFTVWQANDAPGKPASAK
jgi:hypothetical protein